MADCARASLTQIPESLPADADWLILSENNLSVLDTQSAAILKRLNALSKLVVRKNEIKYISDDFMRQLGKNFVLDISKNDLRSLPRSTENVTSLQKIIISENSFICSCENLWMRNWMLNNKDVVDDFSNVQC